MKDSKRKLYYLIILTQVVFLLAICVLPVFKQVKSMINIGSGKEQSENSAVNSNRDEFNDKDESDAEKPQSSEEEADTNLDGNRQEFLNQLSTSVRNKLESMTLEEKIAQLFIISPESLTGNPVVNAAGNKTKEAINLYPVGGLFYTAQNMKYKEQVLTMIQNTQSYSQERIGLPMFLGVNEDGGINSAFTGKVNFDLNIDAVAEIGASKNIESAGNAAKQTGRFLKELGFNFILGPIADITAIENSETEGQTFGTDVNLVAGMVTAQVNGFKETGISTVLKYFPGKGYATKAVEGDYPVSTIRLEGFEDAFKVYTDAIEAGADFVMVGHIGSQINGQNGAPASMYANVVTQKLRNDLGFEGLILTEALNEECITKKYSSVDAALTVFTAGADMIFLPENFEEAYQGMLQAVRDGRITESRVDESVARVLKAKME